MPSYEPPKKNSPYVFYTGLRSRSSSYALQDNPSIGPFDVGVQLDDGSLMPLATTPTASGKRVKVSLSAAEMNADNVTVIFSQVTLSEWCDQLINIQTTIDIYPADISLTTDEATGADEWTVSWFRNGTPLEAVEVTLPTIRVVSRATGADLLSAPMDPIDAGASYKYDSSIIVEPGQAVIVEVGAEIDGAERIWRKIISRDSA